MRVISKKSISICLVVFAIISSALLLAVFNIKKSSSIDPTGVCTAVKIQAPNQTPDQTMVSLYGTAELYIKNLTYQPSSIIIGAIESGSATPIEIGRAQPTASGSVEWKFVWPTQLWKGSNAGSSNLRLRASIAFQNGTSCEVDSTAQYYISYNPIGNLLLNVYPPSISMNVGSANTQEIIASPTVTPTSIDISIENIKKYGVLVWSTENDTIGSMNSSVGLFVDNSRVAFNAGVTAGLNTVKVQLRYGGSVGNAQVPIVINDVPVVVSPIVQPDNPNNDSSNTSNTDNTDNTNNTNGTSEPKANTPVQASDLQTQEQVTSSKLILDESTKSCLLESGSISKDRLQDIIDDKSQPTAEEYKIISNCSAASKYMIPTTLAPVDPNKIEKLNTDEKLVSISKIENAEKTTDTTKKETLKITGKAKANSVVFIYMYSDPIIITTTADSNGNWTYVLEDPLVPGKHEVYAVVNKGDGTYTKSEPFTFIISKVAASSSNPNGLGLKLAEAPKKTATESNYNLTYYIAGSVIVLVIALTGLFIIIKSHHKHKLAIAKATDPNCPHCGKDKNEAPEAETVVDTPSASPINLLNETGNSDPNPFTNNIEIETKVEDQSPTDQKEL